MFSNVLKINQKKVFEKREMTVVNRKNVVCLQQIERRLLLQCVASVGENQRVKGGITEVWRERNCFWKVLVTSEVL